jgi:hypothetical protein
MSTPSRLPLEWRIRAALTVAVVPPLLSLVSFARLSRWLTGRRQPAGTAQSVADDALAEWVDRLLYALPGPWRHTCLKRSAVLYRLARRDGRQVELCIGVRRAPGGSLAAHAWLTRAGLPYLERDSDPHEGYQVIARFPEQEPHGG